MIVRINTPGNILMFKNMNQVIVDKYKRQGITPNMAQHRTMFEQTHGVTVIAGHSNWQALEFATDQDYLMAMLKWR